MMREELHDWLDGEIPEHELSAELRRDAARLRDRLEVPREVGPAPAWIEQGVMARLPHGRPGLRTRLLDWTGRPRTIQVRPVTVGALAVAVLATLLVWPVGTDRPAIQPAETGTQPAPGVAGTGTRAEDGRVHVQFVYVAPEAATVAVAGDFNDWGEASFQLSDADGDGVWSGELALEPGLHKYMFVVDGEWMTDPMADRYVDDGFGNRNALITVGPPGSTI